MKIIVAADHAGFALKEELKKHLEKQGHQVKDMGAFALDKQDDYPDFVLPAAKEVALLQDQGEQDVFGIVIGASGQGEDNAAEAVKGIRSVVYYGGPLEIVELSRKHNNANILALGARFLKLEEAVQAVDLWLATSFEGGRHQRRLDKID